MGVTVYFFSFDPTHYTTSPSLEELLSRGDIDEELEVMEQASGVLCKVESMLGDNKMWYRNIDASWAWELVREELHQKRREALDHWFGHLFYKEHDVVCGHEPVTIKVDDLQSVYDAAWIEHVCGLDRDLQDVMACLEDVGEHSEPFRKAKQAASYPWMFEAQGFEWLVGLWMKLFDTARTRHAGWSLLQWIWL